MALLPSLRIRSIHRSSILVHPRPITFSPITYLICRFSFYHKEKVPSAAERYVDEIKRVLGVLNGHLSKPENKGWLAAGKYTVADLAFISWVHLTEKLPIKLADYPAVEKWYKAMIGRPGTIKSFEGGPYEIKE
jgi:glutathione S-transferase